MHTDHVDEVLHEKLQEAAVQPTRSERFPGDKAYLSTRDNIEAKVVDKPNHFCNTHRKKATGSTPPPVVYADPMNPNNFAGARSGLAPRGRRTYTHCGTHKETGGVLPSKPSAIEPDDPKPHNGKKIMADPNFETGKLDPPPPHHSAMAAKKSESVGMAAVLRRVEPTAAEGSSSSQQNHPSNTPLGNRRVRKPPASASAGAAGRPSVVGEVMQRGGKSVAGKTLIERAHGSLGRDDAKSSVKHTSDDTAGISSVEAASSTDKRHKRPVKSAGNKAAEAEKKSATSSLAGILRPEEGLFKKRSYNYAPPWGTVEAPVTVKAPVAKPDIRPSWVQTPRGPKRQPASERKHIQHVSATQAVKPPWASE